MGDTITLDELAQTEIGQAIIAERNELRAAEQAQAEERRQAVLAEALDSLAATMPAYEALRSEVLPMLETLALHVDRLLTLRNRLRELANLVHRYGGEVPADFPTTLMGTPEFKVAVAQARDVMGKVGGAL